MGTPGSGQRGERTMPRYVIERVYDEAVHNKMDEVGARSKSVAAEHFPDITWEHSHIVSDESGIKSFCVYEAPNTERLHEHAEKLGNNEVVHMYVIAADVKPSDFPD
jgi:hypothetical protein